MLTFHAAGDWMRSQVHLAHAQGMRRIVQEVERLIDEEMSHPSAMGGLTLLVQLEGPEGTFSRNCDDSA